MLQRLIVGLVTGLVIGALAAAVLVRGLGVVDFGPGHALVAYLAAVVIGAVTGLVAGKPIWKPGALIEAGLKSGFGALLAAGMMYALRAWVPFEVDLHVLGAGHGAIGALPAASLPVVA